MSWCLPLGPRTDRRLGSTSAPLPQSQQRRASPPLRTCTQREVTVHSVGQTFSRAVHSVGRSTQSGGPLSRAVHSVGRSTQSGSPLSRAVHSVGRSTQAGSPLCRAVCLVGAAQFQAVYIVGHSTILGCL